MFNKEKASNGYNTYVEHSIQGGELSNVLSATLLNRLVNNTNLKARNSPVIPFCVSEVSSNPQEEYLHEFIKSNTDAHVYVMVPGTNIFTMICNAMASTKTAKKVYVLLLKEHIDDNFKALGDWTIDELSALHNLRKKMMEHGIVVIDDIDKLVQSVIFTIHSGETTSTYRSPKDDAIKKASESAAAQIIDATKRAIN